MKDEYKLTFWKKLKYSIFDFEKYQDLAAEKIWKTIIYIIILTIIYGVISAGIFTFKTMNTMENVKQYIADNIDTVTFENNKLSIVPKNGQETIKIEENKDFAAEIIIATNIEGKEITNDKINELSSSKNAILILSDKVVLKTEMLTAPYAYQYSDIAEQYNINYLDKAEIIRLLSGETITPLIIGVFTVIFLYMFMMNFSSILVDILAFSAMGYLVTLITRIRIKYTAVYNIAAYALTLPIILNIIYFVVNSFTGFTIRYFQVMYIAVASIYIIAAILLIKSDVIKKQIELAKIIKEQDKVREELQRREEEEKERKRKEDDKKQEPNDDEKQDENENKKKKKSKNNEPDVNVGNEPEGNNV